MRKRVFLQFFVILILHKLLLELVFWTKKSRFTASHFVLVPIVSWDLYINAKTFSCWGDRDRDLNPHRGSYFHTFIKIVIEIWPLNTQICLLGFDEVHVLGFVRHYFPLRGCNEAKLVENIWMSFPTSAWFNGKIFGSCGSSGIIFTSKWMAFVKGTWAGLLLLLLSTRVWLTLSVSLANLQIKNTLSVNTSTFFYLLTN